MKKYVCKIILLTMILVPFSLLLGASAQEKYSAEHQAMTAFWRLLKDVAEVDSSMIFKKSSTFEYRKTFSISYAATTKQGVMLQVTPIAQTMLWIDVMGPGSFYRVLLAGKPDEHDEASLYTQHRHVENGMALLQENGVNFYESCTLNGNVFHVLKGVAHVRDVPPLKLSKHMKAQLK